MKILIINSWCHPKNKIGFENILKYLKVEYKYGNINDIKNYDIIYSPSNPIDTSRYPNKKFIFGPHFSVFPDYKLKQINNIHKNSVYIQVSEWVYTIWKNTYIPIKIFPFPVETDKFINLSNTNKNEVFIYYKGNNLKKLEYIQKKIKNYKIINYNSGYNENTYIKLLQNSKYGIWISNTESQGFALQEALSCNVPLIVWNTSNYDKYPATTIPYWDNRCGEYFYTENDFEEKYDKFIKNLNNYKPREFILENLNIQKCSENLINLINGIKV